MNRLCIYLIVPIAVALAGCVAKTPPTAYNDGDFAPASREADPPRPVEIVPIPRPLPLPGQLKPEPRGGGRHHNNSPKESHRNTSPKKSANAAREAATVEPVPDGYVNAIQIYPYTPGALYRLYAAPGQVSGIALQAGEKLVSVSAGDTVRWVVGDTTSGEGAETRVHILVKPIASGLVTNLVVTTNRRAYHLELASTEETYMASVSWNYPRDELIALQRRNARAEAIEARTVDDGLDLAKISFRYEVTGDEPSWRPLRAFDDGAKVYIQFPKSLFQGDAPPLFVVGPKGAAELVNYRLRGNYYIVDRLFAAAELRMGEDPQQVVRITRTGDGEPGS